MAHSGTANSLFSSPPGHELEAFLNINYGPGNVTYANLGTLTCQGVKERWVGNFELDGAKYRRSKILLPSADNRFFSITTVYMQSEDEVCRTTITSLIALIPPVMSAPFRLLSNVVKAAHWLTNKAVLGPIPLTPIRRDQLRRSGRSECRAKRYARLSGRGMDVAGARYASLPASTQGGTGCAVLPARWED